MRVENSLKVGASHWLETRSFMMKRIACLVPLLLISREPLQSSKPRSAPPIYSVLDASEQRRTVEQLAEALSKLYLDPATGVRYAFTLQALLRNGHYDQPVERRAFGEKVRVDLQVVRRDAHLRLLPSEVFEHAPEAERLTTKGLPEGIEEMRMIGNAAYLAFTAFPHDPRTAPAARAFLVENAGRAKAVILDARSLPGGGIEVIDAMLPLFFSERTVLVRLETRAAGDAESPFTDGPTLVRTAGREGFITRNHIVEPDPVENRLRDVPLYYLTSATTASAGEHLALVLKRTKRATLIGEKTRGAGHYVALAPVGSGLTALVPIGRTFDPDTGLDWEGEGISPDISVPADAALEEALKRIR